ncbi:UNVERIFIED_CONTAM: Amino acid permease 3 [Sesamum latifolium]|uniref:Amino acid permease 3 n=1 Tax=Sesamum latifolium TaxID=2727402 RepID=A0AAW2VRG2_9LAMI
MTGYYKIPTIRIQDNEESHPSKCSSNNNFLHVLWLLWLCSIWGLVPGNLLTGFGFYNPYWLIDIANVAIVIHLIGAYQVFCQPLFAFIEKTALEWFPDSKFITKEITIPIPGFRAYKLNFFRLVWRTIFVIITTIISMLMPFFNDVVGILGAFGFWPLTVYFPVEMYIKQKRIPKWSTRWVSLQILSFACLVISVAAAAGSFAGVVSDLKVYKPFKTSY